MRLGNAVLLGCPLAYAPGQRSALVRRRRHVQWRTPSMPGLCRWPRRTATARRCPATRWTGTGTPAGSRHRFAWNLHSLCTVALCPALPCHKSHQVAASAAAVVTPHVQLCASITLQQHSAGGQQLYVTPVFRQHGKRILGVQPPMALAAKHAEGDSTTSPEQSSHLHVAQRPGGHGAPDAAVHGAHLRQHHGRVQREGQQRGAQGGAPARPPARGAHARPPPEHACCHHNAQAVQAAGSMTTAGDARVRASEQAPWGASGAGCKSLQGRSSASVQTPAWSHPARDLLRKI
jgi:hypothetical protein